MMQHTYRQFDAEMENLRTGVLSMGGLVEAQLARSIQALTSDDDTADLINQVGANEVRINEQQMRMDEQCSQIIARRQPAAVDLRTILTITKMVNDLERIGDEVKKIAYKAPDIRAAEQLRQVRLFDVARSAEQTRQMLQMALDAFARLDAIAAAKVIESDTAIDAAFSSILRQLVSYMMEDPRPITAALEIVFIAISIERFGDHAKNIAEAVVQVVKGKDVRHISLEKIQAEIGAS
ncbi:MAG: phosphate signaling complex protein PhoU [Pseudomonadota bacterium]|nr:phosphate signaling complex protein PhoU [Pseudomonadota bacterium]